VTRAELKNAVLLRLGVSSSDTQMVGYINDMLNIEYLRLAAEDALLEKVGTLSLVANSAVLDLPNDWQRTIQITESGVPLRPVRSIHHRGRGNQTFPWPMQRRKTHRHGRFRYRQGASTPRG
jgi:hypothetical protein